MNLVSKSQETVKSLEVKESELTSGALTPATFKPFGAPLGIYEQKDGLFMFRIRIPGGHLTAQRLSAIAKIAKSHDAKFAHLTTRQDLQLHGVNPGSFHKIGEDLLAAGMLVRGGGGNTFRNIIASPLSGLSEDSVFDVMPAVETISNHLLGMDKLFSLPRKYKIAVSDSDADTAGARWNDLGLIATTDGKGNCGFKVFGGGGLGRLPEPSIKLLEFASPENSLRAAIAMGDLFSDHGNREDRNAARIRFILKKLGADAFKKLFLEYYEKVQLAGLPKIETPKKAAEIPAGRKPLNLKFKGGQLSLENLELLAETVEKLKLPFVRTAQDESVWLPAVRPEDAEEILQDFGLSLDCGLTPLTCIGATVCKIGILDTQTAGQLVAFALSKLHDARVKDLVPALRLSGCPNSCAIPQTATVGFTGMRKGGKGCYKVFLGGKIVEDVAVFGRSEESWLVDETRIGDFAAFLATEFFKDGNGMPFKNWIEANAASLMEKWLKGA